MKPRTPLQSLVCGCGYASIGPLKPLPALRMEVDFNTGDLGFRTFRPCRAPRDSR